MLRVIVQSDELCGSLHCDISAVTYPYPLNFNTKFTDEGEGTRCRWSQYLTFYNGPDRSDPGVVPDGAPCDTGKVSVSPK